MSKVVVVGSLSQDLVVKAPRRPAKGETLRGTDFGMFAGGKGNNQALAAARAGADVTMVGRVGADAFGEMLMETLRRNKIATEFMSVDETVGTGIAVITIDGDGDNSIIIAQQANLKLGAQDVERAAAAIKSGNVLLMQLEVPIETVVAAAKTAHGCGTKVILNPAPAPEEPLPAELLRLVDVFVPNQTEAALITNMEVPDMVAAQKAAEKLRQMGPQLVIITMGEQGAFVLSETMCRQIAPFRVQATDTTAAGDAFCGALAAALSRGQDVAAAISFACAAGALATTKLGAEPSLPTLAEINKLMEEQKCPA